MPSDSQSPQKSQSRRFHYHIAVKVAGWRREERGCTTRSAPMASLGEQLERPVERVWTGLERGAASRR
jgi:hypothetical protein